MTPLRLALIAVFLCCSAPTPAGDIALRWDPSPQAAGYRVYFGTSPGHYDNFVDVGPVTSATLRTPEDCRVYHVAVKAYNDFGESVGYSNEVAGPPQPRLDTIAPGSLRQGEQRVIELRGGNFTTGGLAEFEIVGGTPTDLAGNPLMRVDSISAVACDRIQALVSLEPAARGARAMPIGDLRIRALYGSPGGVVGGNVFTLPIAFDPLRADVNRDEATSVDRVDGSDLAWIRYAHGSVEGDGQFLPDADLSGDGIVDGDDLALFVVYFGQCRDGDGWSVQAC